VLADGGGGVQGGGVVAGGADLGLLDLALADGQGVGELGVGGWTRWSATSPHVPDDIPVRVLRGPAHLALERPSVIAREAPTRGGWRVERLEPGGPNSQCAGFFVDRLDHGLVGLGVEVSVEQGDAEAILSAVAKQDLSELGEEYLVIGSKMFDGFKAFFHGVFPFASGRPRNNPCRRPWIDIPNGSCPWLPSRLAVEPSRSRNALPRREINPVDSLDAVRAQVLREWRCTLGSSARYVASLLHKQFQVGGKQSLDVVAIE
jgi:hypothetical protein